MISVSRASVQLKFRYNAYTSVRNPLLLPSYSKSRHITVTSSLDHHAAPAPAPVFPTMLRVLFSVYVMWRISYNHCLSIYPETPTPRQEPTPALLKSRHNFVNVFGTITKAKISVYFVSRHFLEFSNGHLALCKVNFNCHSNKGLLIPSQIARSEKLCPFVE